MTGRPPAPALEMGEVIEVCERCYPAEFITMQFISEPFDWRQWRFGFSRLSIAVEVMILW